MTLDSTIGIIGLTLTALGLILTLRSLNQAIPFYTIREISLFQVSHKLLEEKDLKVMYEGNFVDQILISQFAFWNGGNKLLSFENASSHVPLSISFNKKCKIFNAELQYQSNEYNATQIKYDKENNRVYISFDYLNSKDGFIIKVIHDQSPLNDYHVKGAFKGSRSLKFSNAQGDTTDWLESLMIITSYPIVFLMSSKGIANPILVGTVCVYILIGLGVLCRYFFYRRPKIIPKKIQRGF